MPLNLTICRADEVVNLVNKAKSQNIPFDAVISLEHPGAEKLSAEKGRAPRLVDEIGREWTDRQLILVCYDVEHDHFGVPAPDKKIVTDAMGFIDKHKPINRPMRVLVHCRSGKARSTALGLIILIRENGLISEAAIAELLKIRSVAAPNLAIIKQGDDLLNQKGALVAAILANPDITERRAIAERARINQVESRAALMR